MTLASAAAALAPVSAPEARTLRWNEQGFIFELSSPDDVVLDMAARVFPGTRERSNNSPDRRWHVKPHVQPQVSVAEAGAVAGHKWIISDNASDADRMEPSVRDSRESALLQIEWDVLEFLLRQSMDAVSVHAALLSRGGRGVVIVGPSFAGKSTLATAMWRAAWTLMSDDLVFLDAADHSAAPAPRRVSLRSESRGLVGDALWSEIGGTPSCVQTLKGLFFHPHEVTGEERISRTKLAAIFFLARRGIEIGPAETRPINPAKTALALLPYAFNTRELPFMDGLRRVTPIAGAIPAYDLGRGDLREMVNSVERRIG